MKSELKTKIKKDEFRYNGGKDIDVLHSVFLKSQQLSFIKSYRKTWYFRYQKGFFNKLLYYINAYFMLRKSNKTGILISSSCDIGDGFQIVHKGSVIINSNTKIGKNATVFPGCVIGQCNRGKYKGTPIIGDNVFIGANSVIVGGITIGEDVLISPNSFVNFDIPNHSIVIGNPGRIHFRENATEGYINNKV